MHVQMRHTLTDTVVNRHERSLRADRFFDRAAKRLRVPEKRLQLRGREICERLHMCPGDEQSVSGEQRPMIEKCERTLIFEDNGCLYTTRSDSAKEAVCRHE